MTQAGVGFQQVPPELVVNSMDNIVAARSLFQNMNPRESQVVFQDVNQRLNFQRHGMFVPERLGQARSEPDMPTFRVVMFCLLWRGAITERKRNGMSSAVVKSGCLVHPKVTMNMAFTGRRDFGDESVPSGIGFLVKSGICRFRQGNRPGGEVANADNLGKLNEGSAI